MDKEIKGAMAIAFLAGVMVGIGMCGCVVNGSWKYLALKHSYAYYDQQTGAFVLEESHP